MTDLLNDEFKMETFELLDEAEDALMAMDKGADFGQLFNKVFRAFHSIKGGAGMFQMTELQNHVHQLETLFESLKKGNKITSAHVDYFFKGIDAIKKYFTDEKITFEHLAADKFNTLGSSSPVSSPVSMPKIADSKPANTHKDLIYVVDDEEDICELLEMLLKKNHYQVKTFLNATDALAKVEEDAPLCVISDINMPKISGLQMVSKIREMELDTPLIFISAFVTKETLMEGIKHGAHSFIEKPFKEIQVVTNVKSAVSRYKALLLINRTINLLMYQFSDLEKFLLANNKTSIAQNMKQEFETILKLRQEIKNESN